MGDCDGDDDASVRALLGLMLGDGLLAALPAALAPGGDLAALLPLLIGESAENGVAALARAAFERGCHAGRADVAKLLGAVVGEPLLKGAASMLARNAGHADVAAP